MSSHEYTQCSECHLFVEPNLAHRPGTGLAPWTHLHRGTDEDEALDGTHEPRPGRTSHTLAWWRENGPPAMQARFGGAS